MCDRRRRPNRLESSTRSHLNPRKTPFTSQEELLSSLGTAQTNEVVARFQDFAAVPQQKLEDLAHHALAEDWGHDLYVLRKYLAVHVRWSIEQSSFTMSDNQFYVSAGFLQARYGTPIYLAFERNAYGTPPWYLRAATPNMAAAELPVPADIPEPPPIPSGAEIVMARDHILGEKGDRVRFLTNTPLVAQICAVAGAIQWSINRGLQLPHWYFGRMNYVVPVYLQSREDITQMPDLVAPVQVNPNSLLVRTVLLPHMPYANCRVGVERQDRLPPWLLDTWSQHSGVEEAEAESNMAVAGSSAAAQIG